MTARRVAPPVSQYFAGSTQGRRCGRLKRDPLWRRELLLEQETVPVVLLLDDDLLIDIEVAGFKLFAHPLLVVLDDGPRESRLGTSLPEAELCLGQSVLLQTRTVSQASAVCRGRISSLCPSIGLTTTAVGELSCQLRAVSTRS
jgi:hypothetical protein